MPIRKQLKYLFPAADAAGVAGVLRTLLPGVALAAPASLLRKSSSLPWHRGQTNLAVSSDFEWRLTEKGQPLAQR